MEDNHSWPVVLKNPLIWILLLAILLFFIYTKAAANIRLPKKMLVDTYGVDRKSFNKWIIYFCSDIAPDMEEYKQRRTVSAIDYFLIIVHLGNPHKDPVLTKGEIVEKGDGTYRSLRESVKKRPGTFGLPSYDAFRALQKFPPNIGKRMLEQYG